MSCTKSDISASQPNQYGSDKHTQHQHPTSQSAQVVSSVVDVILESVFERVHNEPAPSTVTSVSHDSQRKSKQVKRTLSVCGITYISGDDDDEGAFRSRDDPLDAVAAKKPRTRRRGKESNDATPNSNNGSGRDNSSQNATKSTAPDMDLSVSAPTFSTSSTQTEDEAYYPTCTSSTAQESLSHAVSAGMAGFISTIGSTINTMRGELVQLQDVVVQLTAAVSEMHGLRDIVQQLSEQMSQMRNAVSSSHQSEVHDLRAALHMMSVQQTETRELRDAVQKTSQQLDEMKATQDAVKQMATELKSLSQAVITSNNSINSNSQPVLKYRSNPTSTGQIIPHIDDDEFPALSSPSHPSRQQHHHSSGANSSSCQLHPMHEQLKQDVMTAMFVDRKEKQRRASNIVISGLQPSETLDRTAVCKLLRAEFHDWTTAELEKTIVSCKRIGRQQTNKPQPLLVVMDSGESAAYFVANARLLRRSHNQLVKDNIYISEDLTPSEAKAAYDLRCQRRAQQTTNGEQQPQWTRDHPGSTATASRLVYRSTRPVSQAHDNSNSSNDATMIQQPPVSSSQHTNPVSSAMIVQATKPTDTANTSSAGRPIQR